MNINAAFNHEIEPGHIVCDIPNSREPEFGFMLEEMSDHVTIYQALSRHPDITIAPATAPVPKFLISFAEDTVDSDGYPTRLIRSLDLERRRRQSLYPDDLSFHHYDISFKDANKSTMRREWEQAANCLRTGEHEIIAKLGRDIPEAHLLDPQANRVSSICITSRAAYTIFHTLEKENAVVEYEICNDGCVLTNPHADRVLGYRKEVEFEGKRILVSNPADQSAARRNALLDLSIQEIENYIADTPFKGRIAPASISKVCHANEVVRLDYERTMPPTPGIKSGLDWALLQNVRAFEFIYPSKIAALARLTETIPPSPLLMPDANPAILAAYFPEQQKYPLFPVPCLKC